MLKQRTAWGWAVLTTVVLAAGAAFSAPAMVGELVEAPKCGGITFTSETCGCSTDKCCDGCKCGECKPGTKDCPCVAKLVAAGGVIKGSVKHFTVKKYETIVWVEEISGKTYAPPKQPVRLNQEGKEFKPRVLPILEGSTVEFLNSDDMEHNVFSPDGEGYNLGNWGKGQKRTRKFSKAGTYVQLCKLHPEMVGYVLVVKTPYWAEVAKDGTFRIPNVPPGKWKLKVWNERLKSKNLKKSHDVSVTKQKTVEVEIKA